MADVNAAKLRDTLAGALLEGGQIRSQPVAQAFRDVPRHEFLPGTVPSQAYADEAIPVKWSADGRPVSSSSQPAIMAIMLEQLAAGPGQRILEIGTGTGYNAALLAHLVGDNGAVVTVEMDADLAGAARERLRAAGCQQVTVVHGDGAAGWQDGAPYDRIIATASARDLAPAWTAQLTGSGRIVVPLSLRGVQQSVAFERAGNHLASVSAVPCGFMPLRGALAGPDPVSSLGKRGLFLRAGSGRDLDLAALAAALGQPGETLGSGVVISVGDLFGGLGLWLALHDDDAGALTAVGEAAGRGLIPAMATHRGVATATALVGRAALAVLVRATGGHPGESTGRQPRTFEAAVRSYGRDAGRLAPRLVSHIRDWEAAGRPSTRELRIRAYPAGPPTAPSAPAVVTAPSAPAVVTAPHTRFLLDW